MTFTIGNAIALPLKYSSQWISIVYLADKEYVQGNGILIASPQRQFFCYVQVQILSLLTWSRQMIQQRQLFSNRVSPVLQLALCILLINWEQKKNFLSNSWGFKFCEYTVDFQIGKNL